MEEENNETMSKYIDKSVVYFLTAMLFVTGTALAYRFYSGFSCDTINMDIRADDYRVGELITFTDYTERAKQWEWRFGDSTEVSTKKEALHVFEKPGKYVVKLLVNNTCELTKEVIIEEEKVILDPDKIPKFSLPESIQVGETLKVEYSTENAYSWEWRFGETAKVNSTRSTASYVYDSPGLKEVSLIINGDILHISKKRIKVLPKPDIKQSVRVIKSGRNDDWYIPYDPKEEETVTEITYENITDQEFEYLLDGIAKGNISNERIMKYFCGKTDKTITVNGKRMKFTSFCKEIKDKKINIKTLHIEKEKETNCIKHITVEYKWSWLRQILNKS